MKIVCEQEYKGFGLDGGVNLIGGLAVLTGMNGSGKTRFLSGLASGAFKAELNGELLGPEHIRFFEQSKLQPNFHNSYDEMEVKRTLDYIIRTFKLYKDRFDLAYVESYDQERGIRGPISSSELHRMVNDIARILKKKPSDLTESELSFYYKGVSTDVFSPSGLVTVFNQYLKLKEQNKYNLWRVSQGEDVYCVKEDAFEATHGEPPWKTLNDIIYAALSGKFRFTEPSSDRPYVDVSVLLIDAATGKEVAVGNLSSGEQTLLWLALVLFNTQYAGSYSLIPPKILLLDEPDAFLHPSMVMMLLNFLSTFKDKFGTAIIITTHSPTTVALAPEGSIYVVGEGKVSSTTRDSAIDALLDGVSQISLDPNNRRQVFVESFYDANFYEELYLRLRAKKILDSEVSLAFIPSGAKASSDGMSTALKSMFGIDDPVQIKAFVDSVNGVGSCSHVTESVKILVEANNRHVRGLIDWDGKNRPTDYVVVLAKDYAYTIENIALDPIAVLLMLHNYKNDYYPMEKICGANVDWLDWLKSEQLLQVAVDNFILKVLGVVNLKDSNLEYCSGLVLKTDRRYLMCGSELESKVIKAYPQLNSFIKTGRDKDLKFSVVKNSMVGLGRGDFIPVYFKDAFLQLQDR